MRWWGGGALGMSIQCGGSFASRLFSGQGWVSRVVVMEWAAIIPDLVAVQRRLALVAWLRVWQMRAAGGGPTAAGKGLGSLVVPVAVRINCWREG